MKLGGSLQRHRRRRGRAGPEADSGSSHFEWGGQLLLWIAGLGLGGWAVGYLISTQLLFPAPPPPGDLFEVPDLRGLGVSTVQERLGGAGLSLGTIDSLQHPSVTEGLVLGQSPLAGQVAHSDTPVRITVSAGPQRRSVPDVVELEASRARIVLETSGFVVALDSTESEVPRGRVIEIFPPPDSVVPLPSEVRVVVSSGPPVVPMPMVLGLEEVEARAVLDSLGLSVESVEEVYRYGRDQGIVVQQEPASDMELRRGSPVRLWVGRRGLGPGDDR